MIKTALFSFALVSSAAFADVTPTAVPLNNVSVKMVSPAAIEISFTVPFGGSCHSYVGKVQNAKNGTVVTILDYAMANCTRPEELNHADKVQIHQTNADDTITLTNLLYVPNR